MGKKYYCDYCDKSFADNATSRKNHMRGLTHQRLKKAHYESLRDPSVILIEELGKAPCREYRNTGYCKFGNACRYSHLTEEDKQSLRNKVAHDKESTTAKQCTPTLDSWLAKHPELSNDEASAPRLDVKKPQPLMKKFSLPTEFQARTNLPPSLYPPDQDVFSKITINEWG